MRAVVGRRGDFIARELFPAQSAAARTVLAAVRVLEATVETTLVTVAAAAAVVDQGIAAAELGSVLYQGWGVG